MASSQRVKQVIVLRADLKNKDGQKVRTGKLCTQASHAAMCFLVKKALIDSTKLLVFLDHPSCVRTWIADGMTKATLKVNSEDELVEIYNKAKDAGLPVEMIQDAGLTEFSEPTKTCIAIGPYYTEEINKITGHLSLF